MPIERTVSSLSRGPIPVSFYLVSCHILPGRQMADSLRKAEVWVIFGWWGVTFITTANCINKCIVMWCNLLAVKAHFTRSQTVSSLCVKLFQYPKSASNLVMCLKYFASGSPTRSGSLLWNGISRSNNTLLQLWFLLSTILKRLQFARLCVPTGFQKDSA